METLSKNIILSSHITKSKEKKLYLESYGCQMNEYDSGIVRSILSKEGYGQANVPEEAELILLNTCAIREKAQERIYGRLASFTPLKKKNPKLLVGILGCMAQNMGDDLFSTGLPVDFAMGPDNYRQLPTLLEKIKNNQTSSSHSQWNITHLSRSETYEELQPKVISGKLAFVTIMRGCDNFCSFCVVPYTRGRERSRSPESIVSEINAMILSDSICEVTLLGQNVNSYHYKKISFCELIKKILEETNIQRIRFTSPHPHDFPEELLHLMAQEERFCSQIHLPLQSGSSAVLQRMKRDYNRREYEKLVSRIRAILPKVGLSTDIIVGFCGETQEEFEETLDVVDNVSFDMAYMFYYSEREHTSAKKHLCDDVAKEVKLHRLSLLIEKQQTMARKINEALVGETFSVLIEGHSRRSQKEWMGRTSTGKSVVIQDFAFKNYKENNPTNNQIGQTLLVQITSCSSATLKGVLLSSSE